jgi:hypothetical protein
MKQAIDELKAIPGVVGACLFGAQEGLLQCNLPGIFKPDKLTEVGKQLAKLLAAGRMSFDDLNDLSLYYDESVVIARELRKGLVVFAICDPSFNHNLLTMSLNLLQEELRDQSDVPLTVPADLSAPPAQTAVASGLEPLMAELKTALSKVLGPMAAIIFDEIRQDWAQQGETTARLGDLQKMLNIEIDDPEKIASFESLAAPLLRK